MRSIIEEYGMAVLYLVAGILLGATLGTVLAMVSSF